MAFSPMVIVVPSPGSQKRREPLDRPLIYYL